MNRVVTTKLILFTAKFHITITTDCLNKRHVYEILIVKRYWLRFRCAY